MRTPTRVRIHTAALRRNRVIRSIPNCGSGLVHTMVPPSQNGIRRSASIAKRESMPGTGGTPVIA